MEMPKVKVVFVGDTGVGKTCSMISYTENRFPEDFVPSVFDNYTTGVEVDGQMVNLTLWDTAVTEDYPQLRALSYPDTDTFVVMYSVVCHESYENVESKWVPELRLYCPSARILLVGSKTDLRQDSTTLKELGEKKPLTPGEGEALQQKLNLDGFVEISSLSQRGLEHAFETAVRLVFDTPPHKPPAPEISFQRPNVAMDVWKTLKEDDGGGDIRIRVGEEVYPSLKFILAVSSPAFARALGLEHLNEKTKNQEKEKEKEKNEEKITCKVEKKGKEIVIGGLNIPKKIWDVAMDIIHQGSCDSAVVGGEEEVNNLKTIFRELEMDEAVKACDNWLKEPTNVIQTPFNWTTSKAWRKLQHFSEKGKEESDWPCDVKFWTEGKELNAHRLVLRARNKHFVMLLASGMKDADSTPMGFSDICSFDTLQHFIHFCYFGQLPPSLQPEIEEETETDKEKEKEKERPKRKEKKKNGNKEKKKEREGKKNALIQLLIVAHHKFNEADLLILCEQALSTLVDRENMWEMLAMADTHNAGRLIGYCLWMMAVDWEYYEAHKKFKDLKEEWRASVVANRWPPEDWLKWYRKREKSAQSKGNCSLQ